MTVETTEIAPESTETPETPEGGTSGMPDPENGSQTDKRTAGLVEARDRYKAERDESREALTAAQARIEGFLTAEAERAAGEYLGVPSDLWSGGLSLADVLDDEGNVDVEAIKANAETIIAERGDRFAKNQRAVDSSQGLGGQPGKAPVGWEALGKF